MVLTLLRVWRYIYVAEAKNIVVATIKYLLAAASKKIAPFSHEWLPGLHKEMFGNVWDWAGKFGQVELSIGISTCKIICRLFLNDAAGKRQGVDSAVEARTVSNAYDKETTWLKGLYRLFATDHLAQIPDIEKRRAYRAVNPSDLTNTDLKAFLQTYGAYFPDK